MSRYSIRITFCTFLLFWGLVSGVYANYYSVEGLRDLNPELWDELELNRFFPYSDRLLEIVEDDNWVRLLQEIVTQLRPRRTPSNRFAGIMGVIARLAGKPRFDPALFPVVWLAFREIREVLPFEYRDNTFLEQLRNFRSIEFPHPLHCRFNSAISGWSHP